MSEPIVVNVNDVKYREDLYPRIKPNHEKIQEYADNIEVLPPIEINQHNELIDGFHRWTAHKQAEKETILAFVTETASDIEFEKLAYLRNATHGLQLSREDKKNYAIKHYPNESKEDIASLLSVSVKTVTKWVENIDKNIREERERVTREMWLACYTQEEIAERIKQSRETVSDKANSLVILDKWEKIPKNLALFNDEEFEVPLYNVWSFEKSTNSTEHFGKTEQRIVENLLYLYTDPFDIVVDPFAGGGSTIDVCQRRLRRYWVSDRKPAVSREHEIRRHDILDGVPALNNRWSDVSLLYLDPPYWKQAEKEYSEDVEDLANQDIDTFYSNLVTFINECADRMSDGSHIALIIQPTQWRADDRHYPVDHVVDLIFQINAENLRYKNRIICPYNTQQYNAQQVKWAKENKEVLTLNRELIIWTVCKGEQDASA